MRLFKLVSHDIANNRTKNSAIVYSILCIIIGMDENFI